MAKIIPDVSNVVLAVSKGLESGDHGLELGVLRIHKAPDKGLAKLGGSFRTLDFDLRLELGEVSDGFSTRSPIAPGIAADEAKNGLVNERAFWKRGLLFETLPLTAMGTGWKLDLVMKPSSNVATSGTRFDVGATLLPGTLLDSLATSRQRDKRPWNLPS